MRLSSENARSIAERIGAARELAPQVRLFFVGAFTNKLEALLSCPDDELPVRRAELRALVDLTSEFDAARKTEAFQRLRDEEDSAA